MTVLVSGAGGYIGRHLADRLTRQGRDVLRLRRDDRLEPLEGRETAGGPDRLPVPEPVLVHLAGAAGRTGLSASNRAAAVDFADRVISFCKRRGVRRLVLASSIYARIADSSPYGNHKLEVEALFRARFEGELVVLRLPPVYGGDETTSGVSKLWRMVSLRLPLPFGLASAPRDYLAIGNLTSLIERLITTVTSAPTDQATRAYEPSDGFPISTRDLVKLMARLQKVRPILVPMPIAIVEALDRAIGRGGSLASAFEPLISAGNGLLAARTGWVPTVTMPDSLAYLRARR